MFDELERRCCIRRILKECTPGPGRKPSPLIEVHPDLLDSDFSDQSSSGPPQAMNRNIRRWEAWTRWRMSWGATRERPRSHPAERREHGKELCERLCAEVAEIGLEDIGQWKPAWEITAPSDAAFLEALTAWEGRPGPTTLNAVRCAYRDVLDSWRRAAGEYDRERAER